MPDYVPRRDSELVLWSANFVKGIGGLLDDEMFGEHVTSVQDLQRAFAEAYSRAVDPQTRSPSSIVAKDTARAAMVRAIRSLKGQALYRPDATNEERINLGCKPVRQGKPPVVPPPTEAPTVTVIGRSGTTVTIRLSPQIGTRKKRPAGATSAIVFKFVGDVAPADLGQWELVRATNDVIIDVPFDPTLRPGTKVWITARWQSPTSQRGPAAHGVYTWIAGGELTIAA